MSAVLYKTKWQSYGTVLCDWSRKCSFCPLRCAHEIHFSLGIIDSLFLPEKPAMWSVLILWQHFQMLPWVFNRVLPLLLEKSCRLSPHYSFLLGTAALCCVNRIVIGMLPLDLDQAKEGWGAYKKVNSFSKSSKWNLDLKCWVKIPMFYLEAVFSGLFFVCFFSTSLNKWSLEQFTNGYFWFFITWSKIEWLEHTLQLSHKI